jgi:hypothetical protein
MDFIQITNDEDLSPMPKPEDPRMSQAIIGILLYEVDLSSSHAPIVVFNLTSASAPVTSTHGSNPSKNWEFAQA